MKIANTLILTLVLFLPTTSLYAEEEKSRTGTVTDIKLVSKYVYLKLDEQGEETWIAASRMKISPGDKVEYLGGGLMKDFYSKALDKTFGSIRFVTRIRVLNKKDATTGQTMPQDKYHKDLPKKKQAIPIPKKGDVARAAGGKTIEEIYTEYEQLKDKVVELRAEVIKVSKNILGKNWITISDGTGTAPNNKLIAITSEIVPVGKIFTVKGIVKTDVNLGAGYKYKVLLEEATFTNPTVTSSTL